MSDPIPVGVNPSQLQPTGPPNLRWDVAVVVLVWVSLLLFSLIRTPIPAVNEPHYFAKAKHYWDPAWCATDFFLNSADAHRVFYQTFGSLTLVCSLPVAALISRCVLLALFAVAWHRFCRSHIGKRWTSLIACWLYLAVTGLGNLSGEWVIGGAEAKVAAYAFVLLALAGVQERRWWAVAILSGLAVAFHPVVGIWSLAALFFALVIVRLFDTNRSSDALPAASWFQIIGYAVVCLGCALPGLWPALSLVGEGSAQANHLQVFVRLKHHLDPLTFPPRVWALYGLLFLSWLACTIYVRRSSRERRNNFLSAYVVGAMLIAAAGLVIAYGPRPPVDMPLIELRTSLLKFYPFRLFDAILPMVLALAAVQVFESATRVRPRANTRSTRFVIGAISAGLFLIVTFAPYIDRNPSRMNSKRRADWIAACEWVSRETPADSALVTPQSTWAFKWFAQRAEFFSYKDCPQDASGLLEWNRRRVAANQLLTSLEMVGVTPGRLRLLASETDCHYALLENRYRSSLTPDHQNESFAVFELPTDTKAQ